MNIFQAIILGIIQGLTEFIPISSSAHLSILHRGFGWNTANLLFDVTLHLGTLIALLLYFGREWALIMRVGFFARMSTKAALPDGGERSKHDVLLWPIVLATIPAALTGAIFEHHIEAVLGNPLITGVMMIALGILMYAADLKARHIKSMNEVTMKDWLIVGLAQALAIIPGVSRSGVTITAGLFSGLKREAAARFSFLLGTPVILGAAVYEMRHLSELTRAELVPFIAGLISATLVGYIAIGYLIEYLKRRNTFIFFAYRIIFGLTIIILYSLGYLRG